MFEGLGLEVEPQFAFGKTLAVTGHAVEFEDRLDVLGEIDPANLFEGGIGRPIGALGDPLAEDFSMLLR